MKTTTQELIERIKTSDNVRSLNTWLAKNEKRLIEKDQELLKDVAIQSQKAYVYAGDVFPPQFVVDRANNVINDLLSKS